MVTAAHDRPPAARSGAGPARSDGRWRATVVLALGLLSIVAVQLSAHVIPAPLYDGMMIIEPYRYLDPPDGAAGKPTRIDRTRKRPKPGRSVSGSTGEVPPQAQLFTTAAHIAFRRNATGYRVTIEPVLPDVLPSAGYLVGNAYTVELHDDRGRALAISAGKRVTLALRAPAGVTDAAIAVLVDGSWLPLKTYPSGLPDMYLADVDTLGTYGIVSTKPDPGCYGYYLPGSFVDDGDPLEPSPTLTAAAPIVSPSPCPALMADDPEKLFQMDFGATPEPRASPLVSSPPASPLPGSPSPRATVVAGSPVATALAATPSASKSAGSDGEPPTDPMSWTGLLLVVTGFVGIAMIAGGIWMAFRDRGRARDP